MSGSIEGTITIDGHDEPDSKFCIDSDGTWQQWGAGRQRLGLTVAYLEAMADAMQEAGL